MSAVACSIVAVTPQIANAQEETAAEDQSTRKMDTVMVTARSRAESIQDVPLSITALDEEALESKNIANLEDVARFTSGFSFENFSGGFSTPVIRGQAQTRVTALESNVSTFFDGVYIPRSWAVDVGTSAMSRIEVVKGPQSARYGRNATTKAPRRVSRALERDALSIITRAEPRLGAHHRES